MRNDDAFAAAYVLNDEIGLVTYKVQADGSLHGLWTLPQGRQRHRSADAEGRVGAHAACRTRFLRCETTGPSPRRKRPRP